MKARRIARELAVIVLSQLPKSKEKIESFEIEALLTRSTQSLADYAKQLLEESSGHLTEAAEKLDKFEMEHPKNANLVHKMHTVDVSTGFLREHLEVVDRALKLLSEAIVIPELTLSFNEKNRSEVRDFAIELIMAYVDNREMVEKITHEMKTKWRTERMMSIDRNILCLAVTEMYFKPEIPVAVAINEAVELCHRFADERAAKFLNGVLGDLDEEAEYFRETGELKPKESNSKTSEEPVA